MERIKYEIVVLIIGGKALLFWKYVYGSLGGKIFKVLNSFYEKILKKIMKKLGQDIKYLLIAIVLGLLIPQITSNKPNVLSINSITEKKEKVFEITENLQFDITNFTIFLVGALFLLIYFQCKHKLKKNKFRKNKLKKYMENIFLFLALTKIFLIFMNSRLSTLSELSIFKEYFELIKNSPLYVLNKIYPFLLIYFFSIIFHIIREENKIEKQKESKKTLYKSRESQRKLLEKYLMDDDVSEILIDGKWGIGKTYFIEASINQDRPKVVVDVFLYNDRKKIIEVIIKELKNIYFKEGNFEFEIEKLEKYFDVFQKSIPFNLISFFSRVESKEELKEHLKSIHLEEKSPIIIIENLDRILEKNIILEIIASLHELKDFLGIKIIVLGDLEILNHTLIKGCDDINHQGYLKKYLEKFFLRKLKLKEIDYIELLEMELKVIMQSRSIESIFDILNEGKNVLYLQQDESHKNVINEVSSLLIELERVLGNPRKIKTLINEYKKLELLHGDIFQKFKLKKGRLFLLLAIKEIEKNILDVLRPDLNKWEKTTVYKFSKSNSDFLKNAKQIFLGLFLNLKTLSEIEMEFLVYLKEENELCFLDNIEKTLFKNIETGAINLENTIKKIKMTRDLNIELGLDLYGKVIENLFEYHFKFELENLNCQYLILLDREIYFKRGKTLVSYLVKSVEKNPNDTIRVSKVFLNELFLTYKNNIRGILDQNLGLSIYYPELNNDKIFEAIKCFLYHVKIKKENLADIKNGSYEWEEEYFIQLLKEDKFLERKIGYSIKHLLEIKKIEDVIVSEKILAINLKKDTATIEEKLQSIFEKNLINLTSSLSPIVEKPNHYYMSNLNLYREEIQKEFNEKKIKKQNKNNIRGFNTVENLYYRIRTQLEEFKPELITLKKIIEEEEIKNRELNYNSFRTLIMLKNLEKSYSWCIHTMNKSAYDSSDFNDFYNFINQIKIEKWLKNNDEFFFRKDWNTIKNLYESQKFGEIFDYYVNFEKNIGENKKEIALKTYENYSEVKNKLEENNWRL